MINRVTNQQLLYSAQRNLQNAMSEMGRLQDRVSSQKEITKPSDDPAAVANLLRVRQSMSANSQYSRNIADGQGWLNTIDSALSAVTSILHRARDLTVQGSNDGVLTTSQREAIASELDSLSEQLLAQANTSYLGRSVFAGNSDAGVAFQPDYSYTGTPGSSVTRRVADESAVRVDSDGAAVFGEGSSSMFQLLKDIASDLRSGVSIAGRIDQVDTQLNATLTEQAVVGSRLNGIEKAQSMNLDQSVALEAQRSGVEDADLSKAILDLKMQETSYQAALAVTARALPATLADFLR